MREGDGGQRDRARTAQPRAGGAHGADADAGSTCRRARSRPRTGSGTRATSPRSSARSGWTSTRRARATRRSGTCARSTTRPPATTASRSSLTAFPAEGNGAAARATSQIIEGPIAFQSLCEHHALPFHGFAHIGYIAGDRIIGISKLTRLVRLFARRFTVQERLGEQIADGLVELVAPRGVAVHLEASHLCTQMRGVEEHSRTITTFWRGAFDDPELRREFLHEVRSHRHGARHEPTSRSSAAASGVLGGALVEAFVARGATGSSWPTATRTPRRRPTG